MLDKNIQIIMATHDNCLTVVVSRVGLHVNFSSMKFFEALAFTL
jgi:hypothetical protein